MGRSLLILLQNIISCGVIMLRRFELGDKLNYFQLIDLHPRSGAELVNGRVSSSNSRIVSSAYSEG